jgi:hypothetical protein
MKQRFAIGLASLVLLLVGVGCAQYDAPGTGSARPVWGAREEYTKIPPGVR